ncbi:hypothetical protein CSUI_003041, partial [Cystoisospora suis]
KGRGREASSYNRKTGEEDGAGGDTKHSQGGGRYNRRGGGENAYHHQRGGGGGRRDQNSQGSGFSASSPADGGGGPGRGGRNPAGSGGEQAIHDDGGQYNSSQHQNIPKIPAHAILSPSTQGAANRVKTKNRFSAFAIDSDGGDSSD